MSMFSTDIRVANTATPSFQTETNVGQFGWTTSDRGHYNQLIQYVDEVRDAVKYIDEKIVYFNGILVKLEKVEVAINYIDLKANEVGANARKVEADRVLVANLHNAVQGWYDYLKPAYEDIVIKYQDILSKNEETVLAAASAAVSEAGAKEWYDKSYDIYLDLKKGQVYRGTWNPKTNTYPLHEGTNSVWDVILDAGTSEVVYDGKTWLAGDRLLYVLSASEYQQLSTGSGVTTVNGKAGAVTLTADDVGARPDTWLPTTTDIGAVPTTRTVNGEPLSSNIVLGASDVGALSITGTAAAATKLATARTIGGVSFDGSASINLPGVNVAGNQPTSGNAATATKLATVRTLTVGNSSKTFDGSANQTWSLNEIGALSSTDNAIWKARGSQSDLNTASSARPGYFSFNPNATGAPVPAIYGHGFSIGPGGDSGQGVWVSQVVFGHDSKIYTRNGINAAPTGSWNRIYTTVDKPTASDVGALPLTGGTLTGNVLVGNNDPSVTLRATTGNNASLLLGDGVSRWSLWHSGATKDLNLTRLNDAGASLGNALSISNSTGAVAVTGALTGTSAKFSGNLQVESAAPTIFVNTTSGDASLSYRLNNVQRWIQYYQGSSGDLITSGYDASGGNGKVFSRMKYSDGSVTFAGPLAAASATFSGDLSVSKSGPAISINDTSGTNNAHLWFKKAGTPRMLWYMETYDGSCDMRLNRYDASGSGLGTVVAFSNATGRTTFYGDLLINKTGAALTLNSNAANSNVIYGQSDGVNKWAIGRPSGNQTGVTFNNLADNAYLSLYSGAVEVNQTPTPSADNRLALGKSGLRWSTVYAGTGTINTSDAREKTEVTPLNEAEIAAASAISREIGTYQWLESIKQKGDSARHHVGLTVQRAIEIMEAHGLDPFRYGFICYDKWEAEYQDVDDEAGDLVRTVERQVTRAEERTTTEIKVVDGVPTQVTTVTTEQVPVYEDKAVVDETGNPILVNHPAEFDEDGGIIREAYSTALTHPVPVMESVEVRYRRDVVREAGDRYSFRMDQLALFCLRGMVEQIK